VRLHFTSEGTEEAAASAAASASAAGTHSAASPAVAATSFDVSSIASAPGSGSALSSSSSSSSSLYSPLDAEVARAMQGTTGAAALNYAVAAAAAGEEHAGSAATTSSVLPHRLSHLQFPSRRGSSERPRDDPQHSPQLQSHQSLARCSSRSESLVPEVTDEEFELHARRQGSSQLMGLLDPARFQRPSTAMAQRGSREGARGGGAAIDEDAADDADEEPEGHDDDDDDQDEDEHGARYAQHAQQLRRGGHSINRSARSSGRSSGRDSRSRNRNSGSRSSGKIMPIQPVSLPATPVLAANGAASADSTPQHPCSPRTPRVVSDVTTAISNSPIVAAAVPATPAAPSPSGTVGLAPAAPSLSPMISPALASLPHLLASPALDFPPLAALEEHLPLLGMGVGTGVTAAAAEGTEGARTPGSAGFAAPLATPLQRQAVHQQQFSQEIELVAPLLASDATNVAATDEWAASAAPEADAAATGHPTALYDVASRRNAGSRLSLRASGGGGTIVSDGSLHSQHPSRPSSPLRAAAVAAAALGGPVSSNSNAPFLHRHSLSRSGNSGLLHHHHPLHKRRSFSSRHRRPKVSGAGSAAAAAAAANGAAAVMAALQQPALSPSSADSSAPLVLPMGVSSSSADASVGGGDVVKIQHMAPTPAAALSPTAENRNGNVGADKKDSSNSTSDAASWLCWRRRSRPASVSGAKGTDGGGSGGDGGSVGVPVRTGIRRCCRWSLPVMMTSLSLVQVIVMCVMVWLVGYLAIRRSITQLARSIRETVLDGCVDQLNTQFAQPVQAASNMALLTRLRYGESWPRDLRAFSNTTGWLSDLSYMTTQYPELQRLGLMNSRGVMHMVTKLSPLQNSFGAVTGMPGGGRRFIWRDGERTAAVDEEDGAELASITGARYGFIEPKEDEPSGVSKLITYSHRVDHNATEYAKRSRQLYDELGRPVGFYSAATGSGGGFGEPDILPETTADEIRAFLGPPDALNSTYDIGSRPYLVTAREMQQASARGGRPFVPQEGWTQPFSAFSNGGLTRIPTIAAIKATFFDPVPGDVLDANVSIGVSFALLNLDSLTEKMAQFPVGPNGAILVFDVNGKVLVSSRAKPIINFLPEQNITTVTYDPSLAYRWRNPIQRQLRAWGLIAPEGQFLTPFNASAILHPSVRTARYDTGMDLRANHATHTYTVQARMLSAAQTNGLPYTVLLVTRDSDFTSPLQRNIEETAFVSGCIIFGAVVLSGLITHYATAPLRAICNAMDRAVLLMNAPGRGSPEHKAQLVALLAEWDNKNGGAAASTGGAKNNPANEKTGTSGASGSSRPAAVPTGNVATSSPDGEARQLIAPVSSPSAAAASSKSAASPSSAAAAGSEGSASSSFGVSSSSLYSSSSSSSASSSSCLSSCSPRPLLSLLDFASHLEELRVLHGAFGSMLRSLATHDELEIINKSKRQFIRYIFHEVRVPFNAIVLGIEQLHTQQKQIVDYLASVRHHSHQLQHSSNNPFAHLLRGGVDLARMSSDGSTLRLTAAGVKELTAIAADPDHSTSLPLSSLLLPSPPPGLSCEEQQHTMEVLDILAEQSQVVSRILNDVLSMSKIEDGALELCMEHFRIEQLLRNALNTFKSACLDKRIRLRIRFDKLNNAIGAVLPRLLLGQRRDPQNGVLWTDDMLAALSSPLFANTSVVSATMSGRDNERRRSGRARHSSGAMSGTSSGAHTHATATARNTALSLGPAPPVADLLSTPGPLGSSSSARSSASSVPVYSSPQEFFSSLAPPPASARASGSGVVHAAAPLTLPSRLLVNQVYVRADAYRLRQVIGNLVSNSLKFSSSKSTVRVALELLSFEVDPEAEAVFGVEALRKAQNEMDEMLASTAAQAAAGRVAGNQAAGRTLSEDIDPTPLLAERLRDAAASSPLQPHRTSDLDDVHDQTPRPPSVGATLLPLSSPSPPVGVNSSASPIPSARSSSQSIGVPVVPVPLVVPPPSALTSLFAPGGLGTSAPGALSRSPSPAPAAPVGSPSSASSAASSPCSPAASPPPPMPTRLGVARLRISVKDHGIGLSQAEMDSLFQEYRQIAANKTQKGGGTGLGLSIAKSIIQLHGGTIGVRSNADIAAEAAAAAAVSSSATVPHSATARHLHPAAAGGAAAGGGDVGAKVMSSPLSQGVTSPLPSSSPGSGPSPSPGPSLGLAALSSAPPAAGGSAGVGNGAPVPAERGSTFWVELPLEVFWRADEVSSSSFTGAANRPLSGAAGNVAGAQASATGGDATDGGNISAATLMAGGNSSEAHSTSYLAFGGAHIGGAFAAAGADQSSSELGGPGTGRRGSDLLPGSGGRGTGSALAPDAHLLHRGGNGGASGCGGGSGGIVGTIGVGRPRTCTFASSSDESPATSGSDSVHSLGSGGGARALPPRVAPSALTAGSRSGSSSNSAAAAAAGSRNNSGPGPLQPSPEQLRRQLEMDAARSSTISNGVIAGGVLNGHHNLIPPAAVQRRRHASPLSHSRQLSIDMEEGRRMALMAMQAQQAEEQVASSHTGYGSQPQTLQMALSASPPHAQDRRLTPQGGPSSARSSTSSVDSQRLRSTSFTPPDSAGVLGALAAGRGSPVSARRTLNLSGWTVDTGQTTPAEDLSSTLQRLDRMPPHRRLSIGNTAAGSAAAAAAAASTAAARSTLPADSSDTGGGGASASPPHANAVPPHGTSAGARTVPSSSRRLANPATAGDRANGAAAPLLRHHTPPTLARGASGGGASSAASASPGGLIRPGTRVLVVEDSQPNRKLLMSLLVLLKCKVHGVENGLECVNLFPESLAAARPSASAHAAAAQSAADETAGLLSSAAVSLSVSALPFDVVLMDGTMPVMNGIEATRILRDRGFSSLPIVAVTGNALVEDQKAFLHAGANEVLTKPISKSKLEAAISNYAPAR